MAIIGKWSSNSVTVGNAPETWSTAPAIFGTQDRNDSSAYSMTSTGLLTLPSSSLADGYLMVARAEFFDNGARYNPQLRITQASGTGTFVGPPAGGYLRDPSEDRAYVHCWAFVDNPSASSTYQVQWKADTDDADAADTTERAAFEVIPLYYSNHGIYSSTTNGLYGGTSPNNVTGFTADSQSDTAAIEISGNVVTLKTDNRRYLCLGGYFSEGRSGRTQRWVSWEEDGAIVQSSRACIYYRNTANDENGGIVTHLIDRATTNITCNLQVYRGAGVAAGQGGANIDGSTPASTQANMVVLELNSSAEVFHADDGDSDQDITNTSGVDITFFQTGNINFNDSASWTRGSDTGMNAEVAMDALLGANIGIASEVVADSSRLTEYGEFTINGTGQTDSFHGNYGRGNQSSQDTFGCSVNILGFLALTAGQDVGARAVTHTGSEAAGDNWRTQPGWTGMWGINLDTLEDTGAASVSGSGSADGIIATVAGVGERIITGQSDLNGYIATVDGTGERVITGDGSADGFVPTVDGVGERVITAEGSADGYIPTVDGTGVRTIVDTDATLATVISLVDGTGERTITGSGSADGLVATVDGAGSVLGNITGTGSAQGYIPTVDGVGERTITGSGSADGLVATVDGAGTVGTVIAGSGSADGYIPTVSGVGERVVTAEGSADGYIPTVSGTGLRIVTGAGSADGLLPTVDAVGERTIPGSGSADGLVVTIDGTGTVATVVTGTGAIDGIVPTVSGTGERVITVDGSAATIISLVDATGIVSRVGTGDLSAPVASVSGAGFFKWTGSGSVDGLIPTIAAIGERIITGDGSADGIAASVSGSGTIVPIRYVTGDMSAPVATVDGAGLKIITLTGDMAALVPTVSGAGSIIGDFKTYTDSKYAAVNDTIIKQVLVQGL